MVAGAGGTIGVDGADPVGRDDATVEAAGGATETRRGPGVGPPGRAGVLAGAGPAGEGAAADGTGADADGVALGVAAVGGATGAAAGGVAAVLATGATLGSGLGKVSWTLRTTGASTVEDADLTYSPIALRWARRVLLSVPSSLASALTRTLVTFLLSSASCRDRTRGRAIAGACSLLSTHGVLISV